MYEATVSETGASATVLIDDDEAEVSFTLHIFTEKVVQAWLRADDDIRQAVIGTIMLGLWVILDSDEAQTMTEQQIVDAANISLGQQDAPYALTYNEK